jgi:glycosyltransferase involved in cell wall biosynthesis
MRIGLYFDDRLPVTKYGGTERVVVWLARGLARLGHEPVILTPPGTRIPDLRCEAVPRTAVRRMSREADFRLDPHLPPGLDALHFHNPVRGQCGLPHVTTIQGNAENADFDSEHVFVSRDHMERMGGRHFVYNGIDPADFRYSDEKEEYLLFLGLASRRVKGVDRAERIARRTGRDLVVAGGWRLNLRRHIRSVGLVDDARKRDLLSGARALLNPIRWNEPFGLVVTEALVSGTPVLASPLGSMRELITPEVGFLCQDDDAFVAALERLHEIDPAACRARVEQGFTHTDMAAAYLELYELALEGRLDEPTEPPLASASRL